MTTFSISESLAAPWRVIRRHPLSVLVWGLAMALVSLAGAALLFGALAETPLDGFVAEDPPPELIASLVQVQMLSLLLWLAQMAVLVVIWTAAVRAVLRIGRPEKAFFMRLGGDEILVTAIGAMLGFGFYFAFLLVFVAGIFIAAIAFSIDAALGIVSAILLGLAATAAWLFICARLSLIVPATLILRRFAFVEGWRLARGQTMRLATLLLLIWLIGLGVYLAILVLAAVVLFVFSGVLFAQGLLPSPAEIEAASSLSELAPSPGVMAAVAGVMLLPGSFLYGALLTLGAAPFASACRQLLDGAPEGRTGGAVLEADELKHGSRP
jgi:hypothetical protein